MYLGVFLYNSKEVNGTDSQSKSLYCYIPAFVPNSIFQTLPNSTFLWMNTVSNGKRNCEHCLNVLCVFLIVPKVVYFHKCMPNIEYWPFLSSLAIISTKQTQGILTSWWTVLTFAEESLLTKVGDPPCKVKKEKKIV